MQTTDAPTGAPSPALPDDRSIDTYCALLRATGRLEHPHNKAAFVMLTTLLAPHQLMEPALCVRSGRLLVPGARGGIVQRNVPLPTFAVQALGGRDGAVAELLPVSAQDSWSFLRDLESAMEEVREEASEPDVHAQFAIHQLRVVATHALVSSEAGWLQRTAVMAYAGVRPTGVRATKERGNVSEDDLVGVAALIDNAVEAAGFVISCDRAATRGAAGLGNRPPRGTRPG